MKNLKAVNNLKREIGYRMMLKSIGADDYDDEEDDDDLFPFKNY
jgi:hypothetical protein